MSDVKVRSGLKQIVWEATIIRADGTVEPLGVVSYWHRNPLRRFAWGLKRRLIALDGKRSH